MFYKIPSVATVFLRQPFSAAELYPRNGDRNDNFRRRNYFPASDFSCK